MNMRPKSDAMVSVHKTIVDLRDISLVDKATLAAMRRVGTRCLVLVPEYSPDEIKALRERLHISQAVLAAIINVSPNSIQKWERGAKHPSGPALKLLNLLDRKGLKSVI